MSPTEQPKTDPCFSADEIQALLVGRRPGKAADRLATHVSVCPRCAAVAEAIGLDPGVVSGLRRDDLPPAPSERELADVVARVSRIDRSSRTGSAGAARPRIDLPGRLGPYRLVELLGAGGMGVVYRAEDTALHRFVAVKVVRGGADADTRTRFLSEARALAAVRHDSVVTVYYVGEEPTAAGAIPYLAMELLEGQTLRDWMATAPLPPVEWVVKAGRQISAGLASVHDAGMIHRDVKPANLWLEVPQGWASQLVEDRQPLAAVCRVKLLDFGLAHPHGATSGVAGTPAYMAPEQARGEVVDARADLFSLGCILYELCTGRQPFPERTCLWAGWDSAPTPVNSLNSAVPERLRDLIERLLAADRADRPASARAVELELASLDTGSPAQVTQSALGDATVVAPSTNRHKRRLLVVVAATLVVGTVAVVISTPTNTTHNPSEGRLSQLTASAGMTERQNTERKNTEQQKALPTSDVFDEEWSRALATQPPQLQLNEVLRALGRVNPKFEWSKWGSGWVEPYGVIRLTVDADTVSDLRPVRGLQALRVLRCRGSAPGLGILKDLTPLSELTLEELHCRNNPKIRELSPIRLESLKFLDASHTSLATLIGLEEAPLVTLKITGTPIKDLRPARTLSKLVALDCRDCPITNFRPLLALNLRELSANISPDRDEAVLRQIKTLQKINGLPVKEFWEKMSAGNSQ